MKTQYCAFNVTRQSFINLGVTVADTPFARLRGLIGKIRMRSDEAVWVVPSHGVHTIGLRFAIDVIYLDAEMRVVYAIESLGPLRIPPVIWKCASVLQLPARSIFESGTQVGDQLLIGSPAALNHYWEAQRSPQSDQEKRPSLSDSGRAASSLPKQVSLWPFGNSPEVG